MLRTSQEEELIRRADELGVSLVIGSDHDTRTLSDLLHIVSGARNDLIKPLPAAGDGREQLAAETLKFSGSKVRVLCAHQQIQRLS